MSVDLRAIREAAEAATPGPWTSDEILVNAGHITVAECISTVEMMELANAHYLALLDPQTVLYMVAVCEAAAFMAQQWPTVDADECYAVVKAVRALGEGEGGEKR